MYRFSDGEATPSQKAALVPSTISNLAIEVHSLTYAFPHTPPALRDLTLLVQPGQRIILIGANGAGKSTLLQLLAGKRLTKESIHVLGKDVFHQGSQGVTFLGTEWASNPVVRSDILVSTFLDSVGGWRHKERRDRLLDLLDVDLDWHMHAISDGERRRVQLCMGLMAPWEMLLLDEVTVDLDVLVRHHLLGFLKEESEQRGATVIYATHIFDGLGSFPTHIAHLHLGTLTTAAPIPWPIPPGHPGLPLKLRSTSEPYGLWDLALAWLEEDRERRIREGERARSGSGRGGRAGQRGARREEVERDSEAFYKKYDYSH
ncbi:P-loop containing nucleoside triphosphate hydrolase protein [Dacryopinax primogenitus]|uniref:p-loop containing nucleoside triphosphate hydrolase protein n=1 Tax=Dacryopinax primogenitus (strain DJM 731) TaxID=1858805 RepID=M5FNI8_DACPD|nr:P-loop containing nucleoside triphosphate hydrolase protein [Dacryopinax primogenitus]EJT97520.1 P-loop containing nucleoside triphosphate hydrolase protein [Dacryopinax primogenitus]